MLAVAILAAWPVRARGDDNRPGARLEAIQACSEPRASGTRKRSSKSDGQRRPGSPRLTAFSRNCSSNVEAALKLAAENPSDSAAFEALKFVIRTNRAGPGDGSARAMRMILDRDYTRDPRQDGQYLATVALVLFQYPDAERLLRRVLDENDDRLARAAACNWLAEHLLQQAKIVRRLRSQPEEMKLYEKYTAATPIEAFVKKDPAALDK